MFPGAEPYVSLVENVGFAERNINRVAQLLVYFICVFNQEREGEGALPLETKKAVSLVLRWETAFLII